MEDTDGDGYGLKFLNSGFEKVNKANETENPH